MIRWNLLWLVATLWALLLVLPGLLAASLPTPNASDAGKRASASGVQAITTRVGALGSRCSMCSRSEALTSSSDAGCGLRCDDHVLVSAHDGSLSLLDAEQGNLVWTLDTGAPLLTSSAAEGRDASHAVFPGADGQLYAYEDTSSGDRALTVRLVQACAACCCKVTPSELARVCRGCPSPCQSWCRTRPA